MMRRICTVIEGLLRDVVMFLAGRSIAIME